MEVEHTFRRPTCGSTGYALVRFLCEPSESLSFQSRASWPSSLDADYVALLERAVAFAVVDVVTTVDYGSAACAITLIDVGWDDVKSSEMAFYLATKGALSQVVGDQRNWRFLAVG